VKPLLDVPMSGKVIELKYGGGRQPDAGESPGIPLPIPGTPIVTVSPPQPAGL